MKLMPSKLLLYVASFIIIFHLVDSAVDRTIFKSCDQSSFCRRCRSQKIGVSKFELVPQTTVKTANTLTVDIVNTENNQSFWLRLTANNVNTFRMEIDEKTPLHPRYRVQDSLKGDPVLEAITITGNDTFQITVTHGNNRAVITAVPFKIDFYENNVLSITANDLGLMRFEHLRVKPQQIPPGEDSGSWEETYNGVIDSKPYGPEAIAMDFSFPQAKILFGIPEHSDSFALRPTHNMDPYRLYNLDVPLYEVDSEMAIYGSVPVLYGHGAEKTSGLFWHNAAETWVDIHEKSYTNELAAHFMSESGIIDVFILLAPTPNEVFKQYTDLTGVAPLPQLYTLAYHQCRWNYDNQSDVIYVSDNFSKNDIPLDTMWLDIEYTDGKKYFTWDLQAFPTPLEMIEHLKTQGRHLTLIVDIHIKVDPDYPVYNALKSQHLFTRNSSNHDYEGNCWPGLSSYPDVYNPAARDYLSKQYGLANFPGTTEEVMIWNDMNEPSVFEGPEKTMPKDNLHTGHGGTWEHRDVHNLFGHMQTMSTFQGLLARSGDRLRPFILTRAYFAGTQRYAMMWTGDNTAGWGYLKSAIQTCLAQAVAGISFCGADTGGFTGNPDPELYRRWYQSSAFQPFYRSHANLGTPRREPWLYTNETMQIIRMAIRKRYSFLPYWYTMFYEHERFGLPVMRPILSEYPKEVAAFTIDNQFLLSNSLMVRPVNAPGVKEVTVYFPDDLWYDIDDYKQYSLNGFDSVPVDNYKIPVYQRGGAIIPKKQPIRLASTLMTNDPYTLVICLTKNQTAKGTLFLDDERTYNYRSNQYFYFHFDYADKKLVKTSIDTSSSYNTAVQLERIEIAGTDFIPKSITINVNGVQTGVAEVVPYENGYTVEKLQIPMSDPWTITFNRGGNTVKIIILWQFIIFIFVSMYA